MSKEKEEIKNASPPSDPQTSGVATPPPPPEKTQPPHGRDNGLEVVVTEKRLALIKAWEENEKTRAENKAHKKILAIAAWEKAKEAAIEAGLKQVEEDIEIEKGKERERMKNRMAAMHKEADEKRANVLAKRGQDIIKVQEAATKFEATGTLPTRFFKCFGC